MSKKAAIYLLNLLLDEGGGEDEMIVYDIASARIAGQIVVLDSEKRRGEYWDFGFGRT